MVVLPPFVIVPGIGGSGPEHWQTAWQRDLGASRSAPASWDAPLRDDWTRALTAAIDACAAPPVLVAHSLGCLTAADVVRARPGSVAAALLVTPPDVDDPAFPRAAATFRPVDRRPLGVRALLVGSRDDPYSSLDATAGLAAGWRVPLVDAGAVGHVNEASGAGAWAAGRPLLARLLAEG